MRESPSFNPFPGLRSFEPREEHLFFGRELQIDELLKRLRRTRFLAVMGISGSGKSSLVLSGLIPSLHRGLMVRAGSGWRVAVFRPGDDPIGNLATALNVPDVLGGRREQAGLNRSMIEATLHRGALGLVECVREARETHRLPKHENVLVVVDQFEELFRFKTSSEDSDNEALAFVKLLQEAARQKDVPIYIVMTMRTDFMEHCVEFPGLPETINDGAFLVSRMSREEQRAAIVGPVAVGGGTIAPRLVLRLLNSVGDDPDQLPVLQHSLMRTWDHWEREKLGAPTLDIEQYEAIGTMERALSEHAEEVYEDLDERGRAIAKKMFKALTDKEPGRRGVRRPIQVRGVCEITGASTAEVIAVVDCFRQPGRSFLMPPVTVDLDVDSVVDISHESLMRVWDRLIEWVEEETESAQFYLRLARAAALHEEGSAALWRDPELEYGLRWQEKTQPSEAWARRYDPGYERAMSFLEQSRAARDRERTAEESARRRKLRQARVLLAISGAVTLVLFAFGLAAYQQSRIATENAELATRNEQLAKNRAEEAEAARRDAEREKERAQIAEQQAREQKNQAEAARRDAEREKDRAQTAEHQAREQKDEAETARQDAEREKDRAQTAEHQAREQKDEAETARQDAEREKVRAQEAEQQAQTLRLLESARALAIQTPRLQQEGQEELAALLAAQAYRLTRAHGGETESADIYQGLRQTLDRLAPDRGNILRHQRDMVRALVWTPDGATLISGSDGDGVVLVPAAAAAASRRLAVENPEVRALATSRFGHWLAVGNFAGGIELWDLASEDTAPRFLHAASVVETRREDHPAISSLSFIPSGRGDVVGAEYLASASLDGTVSLWETTGESSTALAAASGPEVYALAASPDGRSLAAAGSHGIRLWDLEAPDAEPRTFGEQTDVRSLAWNRDGRLLAGGDRDGVILLFDLETGRGQVPLQGHTAGINGLAFAPHQDLLASASSDGTVRMWRLDDRDAAPIVLDGHGSWVWSVAFSPDGETLVSGGADSTVRLWNTKNERQVDEICARVNRDLTSEEWTQYLPADITYEKTCP